MSENSLTVPEISALKREIASSMLCALPGIVASFDATYQTVCVYPALKSLQDGVAKTRPLVRDVPVFFPGGKSSGITWTIASGDECLLVFSDLAIDEWFESGNVSLPASDRRHDMSDAFAFVGFRSKPNKLQSVPSSPSFFGTTPSGSDIYSLTVDELIAHGV